MEQIKFLRFLENFKEDIRVPADGEKRFRRNESPLDEIDDNIKSKEKTEDKIAYLFDIFKKIQSNSGEIKENRMITMKKTDLEKLVLEMLNENTGMGYAKYPYHADEYSEDEPDEDYMTEWKSLVDEVCGQKKKNVDGDPKTMEDAAVEVAKLFVKDLELFREVLELSGSNKSVGVEIMKQLKAAKEKYNLNNELKS
jgi:hypothetical protein